MEFYFVNIFGIFSFGFNLRFFFQIQCLISYPLMIMAFVLYGGVNLSDSLRKKRSFSGKSCCRNYV